MEQRFTAQRSGPALAVPWCPALRASAPGATPPARSAPISRRLYRYSDARGSPRPPFLFPGWWVRLCRGSTCTARSRVAGQPFPFPGATPCPPVAFETPRASAPHAKLPGSFDRMTTAWSVYDPPRTSANAATLPGLFDRMTIPCLLVSPRRSACASPALPRSFDRMTGAFMLLCDPHALLM